MNAKQTADKMYTECSPISQIRGSVPSCIVSTSRNVYCVKGGALLCSASTSNPLSFSKAESTFYKDFSAYKTANNETGNEKKKLSLEEELLAERFRASTDVDVSGVQAVLEKNASTTVPVDDASEEKQWWLIVKRPGQTILWKERQEEGESTSYQLFDLFGQVLKSEMTKYKISAPMDLQVVSCSSSPSSSSPSSTNWKFSFVSSGNVYFCSFSTSSSSSSFENALITPFTSTGISGKLEFGTPDFIMQEEFSRYSGVWWSPDKKSVAFSGCDIADTPQAQLLRPDGSVEEMPFPRVGQDNATCSIFVRSVITSENDDATVFKTLPLAAILATYPWVEYIVRLYWLSNSEMAVAVLSRDQERYALIKVPIQALLSLETSESSITSPDMLLTPKANLLKEHNNNNNKESTSSPRWFEESSGNTKEESIKNRLQLLLTEMKHPSNSSSNDENNAKIVNQILSLSLSLSIIRESYIPEAWVDINDETHFFRHSTASSPTTTTIPSSQQQQQQPLSIACVAQEINAATNDGFFHVFVHESNAFWRQVTSASSLPRGILGAGTRIAKDKNGNCWLIARSFLNNAYLQTIVAIPLFSSAYEDEEKQAKVCVLSSPTEDAIGFVVAQNQNSSSLIYHSLSIASSERRIQTQSVADLDSILANTYSGIPQNLNQKSQLVEFITVAVAPASTSTPSEPPAKTAGDIPIPKMNFFEVPIPGGPSTASVEKLQAMIMYPDKDQITNNNNNKELQPLPLFVYTYGGPHVSYCTLTTICASTILECMRRLGFAVLLVDSRMATRHSLKVNSDGKRKMGSFEIRDVLSAVDFVVENQNSTSMFTYKIDPSRVGIHGFSYGGYVSLLALGQAGNRFKVSVAGAPVTDWRLYDTGYTERYMGLLPRDDKCYEDSSVWKLAANFPDEWNRCFILHGFLDENVHITHTQRLIQELIKEGKPFNLLAYPGERHGIRKTKESAKHSTMTTMRAFMEFL